MLSSGAVAQSDVDACLADAGVKKGGDLSYEQFKDAVMNAQTGIGAAAGLGFLCLLLTLRQPAAPSGAALAQAASQVLVGSTRAT